MQMIIQKIAFFLCKIRFRRHMFIIWGQKHNLKNHETVTVRWGVVVNAYGQPDRKISVVDDFPTKISVKTPFFHLCFYLTITVNHQAQRRCVMPAYLS